MSIDSMRGVIDVLQNLPVAAKYAVSALLLFVTLAVISIILIVIWQSPRETESKFRTGDVASTDQRGGVTAGFYINQAAPVTDQQKAEALAKLQADIAELFEFPNRPDPTPSRTLLEQFSRSTLSHQLFAILNTYYKTSILDVPEIGPRLYRFKVDYYEFEGKAYSTQEETITQIGKIVGVRFRQAWMIYYRYALLRSSGLSQQQIAEGGNFLNYSITWDDAERIVTVRSAPPGGRSGRCYNPLRQHLADRALS